MRGALAQGAIALERVTRTFGPAPALAGVTLSVAAGETVLLAGPNGAGKSTLLRIVATALSPTHGRGSVLGHDLVAGREHVRRASAYLGHRTRLYADLTAAENLRFAARLRGLDGSRVPLLLERSGLAEVADEPVGGFSAGMRQRLALARLDLRDPAVLVLDEPWTALDVEARPLVDDVVRRAGARGATVLLATHEPAGALLADRVVALDAGRIVDAPVGATR